MSALENDLFEILKNYNKSFSEKDYQEENNDVDILMEAFGISPELKRENRQYWGRELGMCWQLILTQIFKALSPKFSPAIKFGDDEPADFFVDKDAVDTKYRVGSGDSGTLKKFKEYGRFLKEKGYRPVFLFLRTDNLTAAMTACNAGGWTVLTGEESFKYVKEHTGFDLKAWLIKTRDEGKLKISRK
jgi:hypothetical protein